MTSLSRESAGADGSDSLMESRRLYWRCRRGMKELDVVLERFVRRAVPEMSAEERQAFERFLDLPDPVMLRYLLGYETPDRPELARVAKLITAPRI